MMQLQTLLIPGEDPEKLRQLATSLLTEWRPSGITEQLLLDQIVQHSWQFERLRLVQSQIWEKAASGDPADLAAAFEKANKLIAGLQRVMAGTQRSLSLAIKDLERIQKARKKQSQFSEQTQFLELTQIPEQSQSEYPPVPEGGSEGQFPTENMRRLADWKRQIKQ